MERLVVELLYAFVSACLNGIKQAFITIATVIWDGILGHLFSADGLLYRNIFDGSIVGADTVINTAETVVQALGISLVIVFVYIDLIQSSASLIEMKRAERVFISFFKAIISIWITYNCIDLLEEVLNFFLGLAAEVGGALGGSMNLADAIDVSLVIPESPNVATFLEFFSPLGSLDMTLALVLLLVAFLVTLFVCVTGTIDICLRFLRLLIHVLIAPIALSTLASKQVSFVGKQFLKSFCGVALEVVFCAIFWGLVGPIYTLLTSSITVNGTGSFTVNCFILICTMLVFNTSIKKVGQITGGVIGIQAGN